MISEYELIEKFLSEKIEESSGHDKYMYQRIRYLIGIIKDRC